MKSQMDRQKRVGFGKERRFDLHLSIRACTISQLYHISDTILDASS